MDQAEDLFLQMYEYLKGHTATPPAFAQGRVPSYAADFLVALAETRQAQSTLTNSQAEFRTIIQTGIEQPSQLVKQIELLKRKLPQGGKTLERMQRDYEKASEELRKREVAVQGEAERNTKDRQKVLDLETVQLGKIKKQLEKAQKKLGESQSALHWKPNINPSLPTTPRSLTSMNLLRPRSRRSQTSCLKIGESWQINSEPSSNPTPTYIKSDWIVSIQSLQR